MEIYRTPTNRPRLVERLPWKSVTEVFENTMCEHIIEGTISMTCRIICKCDLARIQCVIDRLINTCSSLCWFICYMRIIFIFFISKTMTVRKECKQIHFKRRLAIRISKAIRQTFQWDIHHSSRERPVLYQVACFVFAVFVICIHHHSSMKKRRLPSKLVYY